MFHPLFYFCVLYSIFPQCRDCVILASGRGSHASKFLKKEKEKRRKIFQKIKNIFNFCARFWEIAPS